MTGNDVYSKADETSDLSLIGGLVKKYILVICGVGFYLTNACSESDFSSAQKTDKKKQPAKKTETSENSVPNDPTVEISDPKEIPQQVDVIESGGGDALCTGTDLVQNGNFDQGNVSFTSKYGFESGCRVTKGKFTPGAAFKYTINEDPGKCHDGYYPNVAGNTGKMLVINLAASGQGMQAFWCQKIKVKAGTVYEMSARMRTVAMSTQTSQSKWTINDTVFSKSFNPDGAWKNFTSKWKAEKDEEIEFCGKNVDQNTESGDLAVDDVSFRVCR
ncbi:MAG: hypothetical protein NT027_16160 [Proteobacteria bacterium]|nr:hypothetical protein [Pseudomonadota bacterium]